MIKISSHLVWFCSLLSFRVVAFGSICREPSSNLDADTVRLNLHMCTGYRAQAGPLAVMKKKPFICHR